MTIYLVILLLSFVFVGFDSLKFERKGKLLFFIPFVGVLTLLAALRPPNIDRDYLAYQTAYGYMRYLGWNHILTAYSTYQMELGYEFLMKLFYSLGFSFQGFLFIYEVSIGILLGLLLYRYSPYFLSSLCLYVCMFYFFRNFTQIRFAFSCILMMYGLFKFAEKERMTAFIYIISAGLIHNSAWIGLLVPLCYMIFYNRWVYLVFPPVGFVVSLFHPIHLILRFMALPEQITRYLHNSANVGTSFLSFVFCYGLLLISVFNYEKLKELFGSKFEYLYIALSLCIFIGLMFLEFPIMQRISGALFTTSIFMVPYIMEMFSDRKLYGYRDAFSLGVATIFLFYGVKIIFITHLLKPYF